MVTKSHLTSGDITEEIGRFANISTFDELFLGTCEDYVEFKVFIEWMHLLIFNLSPTMTQYNNVCNPNFRSNKYLHLNKCCI